MATIGFIGGGNMATAIIKGILAGGVYNAKDVFVSDVSDQRLESLSVEYGVSATDDNVAVASMADIVVLSVKPQMMDKVLEGLKGAIRKNALIISIAAGIKISKIEEALGDVAVIRVMPNTPALIGQGASGIFANKKAGGMLEKAVAICSAFGRAVVVDDEDMIDAVTAVSGSGPAYYFFLMEKMIEAGIEMGLDEDMARSLVLQTAKGAALLAEEADKKGESPAELRKKVTSAGGTTEAAIKVFEAGNFGELVVSAIKRACERAKELSK